MKILIYPVLLLLFIIAPWTAKGQGEQKLPLLKVSDNQRFVKNQGGEPFFWLGDTAWELLHKLNKDN